MPVSHQPWSVIESKIAWVLNQRSLRPWVCPDRTLAMPDASRATIWSERPVDTESVTCTEVIWYQAHQPNPVTATTIAARPLRQRCARSRYAGTASPRQATVVGL